MEEGKKLVILTSIVVVQAFWLRLNYLFFRSNNYLCHLSFCFQHNKEKDINKTMRIKNALAERAIRAFLFSFIICFKLLTPRNFTILLTKFEVICSVEKYPVVLLIVIFLYNLALCNKIQLGYLPEIALVFLSNLFLESSIKVEAISMEKDLIEN